MNLNFFFQVKFEFLEKFTEACSHPQTVYIEFERNEINIFLLSNNICSVRRVRNNFNLSLEALNHYKLEVTTQSTILYTFASTWAKTDRANRALWLAYISDSKVYLQHVKYQLNSNAFVCSKSLEWIFHVAFSFE